MIVSTIFAVSPERFIIVIAVNEIEFYKQDQADMIQNRD